MPASSSNSSSSSSSFFFSSPPLQGAGLRPHFELTNFLHELEEPIRSVDCQSDVMGVLGTSGRLVLRDTLQDGPPITSVIRNPYRIFIDPTGSHTLVAASDGELHYFATRPRNINSGGGGSTVTCHFLLQHKNNSNSNSSNIGGGIIVNSNISGVKDTPTVVPVLTTSNNVAECVCWLPIDSYSKDSIGQNSLKTVFKCLIGTKLGGFVFEVNLEIHTDGVIKSSCRQCLQLPAGNFQSPIASVQVEKVNEMWVIFISTPTRLYRMEGKANNPIELIDNVAKNPELLHVREVFATNDSLMARGTFMIYRPDLNMPAQSYVWASSTGILHGLFNRNINKDLCESEAILFGYNELNTIINEQFIALTKVKQSENIFDSINNNNNNNNNTGGGFNSSLSSRSNHLFPYTKIPLEVVLTAFHMILLYNDRLIILNHPAGLTWRSASSTLQGDYPYTCEIEEKIRFDPFRGVKRYQELRGIIRDIAARKIYIYGETLIWELHVEQEHRQQWKLFIYRAINNNESLILRKRFFKAAYQLSKYDISSKNLVQLLRGKFFLQIGSIRHATDILADCDNFEEVYQLLLSLRNNKVLQMYVEKRYKMLIKYGLNNTIMQTQLACLLALIIVQRLDSITRSESSSQKSSEVSKNLSSFLELAIKEQPELFLNNSYDDLIIRLLEGQGRPELALSYAEKMNKLHYLITFYISHNSYTEAADILSTHSRRTDILETWYEFAPILMKKCPIRLTTAMLRAIGRDSQGNTYILLKLERLIPIFIQYTPEMNEDPSNGDHQVIIFLERCITKFDCVSSVVHNYYLSLLAQNDGERLEEFLESSLFYNVDFALRRCLESRRFRQCVGLYRRLHLYEDAIRTALECSEPKYNNININGEKSDEWPALLVIRELLKSLPDNMEPEKQKKLWLITVKYVMEKNNTRAALNIVEESSGILKLEDILGDMNDTTVIQNFKDAICKSLDAYTTSISNLKEQQIEASRISETLKQEISQLQYRFGYVTARQRCMLCHHALLQGQSPYLIYPNCRHAVHESCAVSKLYEIGGLEAFFSDEGLPRQFLEGITSTNDLARMECVLCGEASILEIDIPLFTEDDSWSVG